VLPHFRGLKTKPSKGFKNTKWRSHFVFWYNLGWEGQSKLVLLDNQKLIVKLERDRFDRLGLCQKKEVYIKPLKIRVFASVA
jgi:hypothetical protein